MATGVRRDDDGPPGAAGAPVLVLCTGGPDDLLAAAPALKALRRAFPRRPLVLAGGPAADVLRGAGIVDRVVPVPDAGGVPPGLRLAADGTRVPHTAVNLDGPGPAAHRLLLAGRPDDVLWFACTPPAGAPDPGWGLDSGPVWDDAEPAADRWYRLVATTGVAADPADRVLPDGLVAALAALRRGVRSQVPAQG